jgi:V/A-type H+/Na+-transporting ATPase subunit A
MISAAARAPDMPFVVVDSSPLNERDGAEGAPHLVRVAGALAEARPLREAFLYEMVHVGARQLLGEVIRVDGDTATLQVYEDTQGLALGEPVRRTRSALTAQLGPGLIGSVVDGIGRPLHRIAASTGNFLAAGVAAETLDPDTRWSFTPMAQPGAAVAAGDVLGAVEERAGLPHLIMVPPGVAGTVGRIDAGTYRIADPIGELTDGTPLYLAHRWPVRLARPLAKRLAADRPLVTGQRIFDFFFPLAEGGCAAVPGGFGTGKTVIEQSLAKFADADVVVFVGCGERGNEMTDVLEEFPRLIDPRTGRPIMERAVLVVNTSNMPVAAREASIYLGVTIAEYFRDMGRRVALMVDSTSRWAEALRELGARLQEMPGEEGFPTYLSSRLSAFYERAGRGEVHGSPAREGSVSIIGAISPPGGDFSEPVTQATLRVAAAVWALDPRLAHQRHFPSVDWEQSYSLYDRGCGEWYAGRYGEDWPDLRARLMGLLQRERELRDVAGLVGPEALEDRDRLVLETAGIVREVLLRQNAYHDVDACCSPERTYMLAKTTWSLHECAVQAIDGGASIGSLGIDRAHAALAALRDAPAERLGEAADAAMKAALAVSHFAVSPIGVRKAER